MSDIESNLKQGSSLQGGKYVIEKTLGQGGFGITYMGLQVGLNRRVAIKEFFMKEYCERDSGTSHVTTGSQGSKKIVERFRTKFVKEAQTIAQLDNPHVIKIHDIFEENGTAYYVMEYIEGGSLEQYVKERHRLDEPSALKFVGQIADALTYIHGKNILHLDVKPSNVLLRENGEAVLIDFGISKHYDESGEQNSTTPVAISKGYAPIEQYSQGGVNHFDPSTDIYSLGAVLYRLLTGEKPAEVSVLISEDLTIPSYVSAHCADVIKKAMAIKKSDRYQSAAEMKAALKAETSFNNKNDDETEVEILNIENNTKEKVHENKAEESEKDRKFRKYAIGAIGLVVLLVVGFLFIIMCYDKTSATSNKEDIAARLNTDSIIHDIKPEQHKVNPTLTLSCKTSGASLYVDGKKKGTGKWSGELSAGSHKVEARLDGYQTETETLDMSDGGTYSHTFPALTAVPTKSETTISTVSSTTSTASSGKINGHEYVDLGLRVKWATCNVGASSPTEYGNYYAWGETSTKSEYTSNSKTYGKNMGDISGNSSYDAARANWGDTWRLPTKAECQELIDNCNSEWTSQNGVKGRKFTSKKNGKSIFLPAAGWRGSSLFDVGQYGIYWSAAPYDTFDAYVLYFYSGNCFAYWLNRDYGYSVRAVAE